MFESDTAPGAASPGTRRPGEAAPPDERPRTGAATSVAESRALGSRWCLALLLFAALWWTLDLAVLRSGVPHPADDHWEDHLIARTLLAGGGFRSPLIYPPLWGLHDPATLTVPVLVHGPLLPLLTVPALALLGPGPIESVAPAAALAAVLALIPLFRLGARHFGPPVGAAAGLLFTLAPTTLEAVHHSGSVILGAALVTWTLDLLARPRPRAAAAGLVAGVGCLVRPEMLVALPVLMALAWSAARAGRAASGSGAGLSRTSGAGIGWRAPLALAGAFALVMLPWWIHHALVVGSPFFNLTSFTLVGFWGARPDVSVMQDFTLTPARWPAVLRAELPHMAGKWFAFAPHAVKNALFEPTGATGWLVPAGLAGAWNARRMGAAGADPYATRRLAAAACCLALIPVASMTLTSHQRLYLVPFATLYALGAAVGARVVVRALPPWADRPRAWIGMLVLLVLPSALPALKGAADEAQVLATRIAAERVELARALPSTPGAPGPPRLVFSDTPDFVAWRTGLPAVWSTRAQFERLYPARGPGDAPALGLPPRARVAGWFHDDFRDPTSVGSLVVP